MNEKLVSSSYDNDLKMIKYAIENGANIHFRNEHALWIACSNGNYEIVKELVKYGADINNNNSSLLVLVCVKDHLEIVQYLIDNGAIIPDRVHDDKRITSNSRIYSYLCQKLFENEL